jgi:hypothetical protein
MGMRVAVVVGVLVLVAGCGGGGSKQGGVDATPPAAPAAVERDCANPADWDYTSGEVTPGDYIDQCGEFIESDGYGEGRYGCATPDGRCRTVEELAEVETEVMAEQCADPALREIYGPEVCD